jgi:hypothetical protein
MGTIEPPGSQRATQQVQMINSLNPLHDLLSQYVLAALQLEPARGHWE